MRRWVGGVVAAALALGCGQAPEGAPGSAIADTTRIEERLDSLRLLVQDIVRASPADDADVCRAVPFGAKPCGGPRAYLVFSAQATDSAALADAVAEFNALDARRNDLRGLSSDCAVVTAPNFRIVNGSCRAGF